MLSCHFHCLSWTYYTDDLLSWMYNNMLYVLNGCPMLNHPACFVLCVLQYDNNMLRGVPTRVYSKLCHGLIIANYVNINAWGLLQRGEKEKRWTSCSYYNFWPIYVITNTQNFSNIKNKKVPTKEKKNNRNPKPSWSLEHKHIKSHISLLHLITKNTTTFSRPIKIFTHYEVAVTYGKILTS